MRVAIATVQVPFIQGGAELMTANLLGALREHGHQAEVVFLPFRFGPPSAVLRNMDQCQSVDFDRFDAGPIDELIALKFPAIYASHHSKRVWLMHQHRSVYELWGTPFGENADDPDAIQLRAEVILRDTESLAAARSVFTISPTVSERLARFNGIASKPLIQPPPLAEHYRAGETYPYVFVPSRIEALKRQDLLVRAMANVAEPVFAVIAGDGGQTDSLRRLIDELGLQHRVKLVGRIDHETMVRYYSNALCVFFAPFAEDLGFVTFEAMLSSKPVLTCTDSGGPTHFVVDGDTGVVCSPSPEHVAAAINRCWTHRQRTIDMGHSARRHYDALDISWTRVVDTLLASSN